jgi:hypothetical protein
MPRTNNGLLTQFGRRWRTWIEQTRGKEMTELEFIDIYLVGGFIKQEKCRGCGFRRNVLNGLLCAKCNSRCVRVSGEIR